ncbi:MAG TPA: VOC family protein [Candidatus Binatia bacterium]|nr:VOC family protein [Candidatus Binatia bacterium]
MSDLGLTHIALPVSNLDASIAFYEQYARMQVVHRRTDAATGANVAWVSDRIRPFVVVLIETPQIDNPLLPLAHLGVGCTSRDEVDRLCEQARGEGRLRFGPTDSGYPVGYWAFIADPDEHTLEVSFGQEVALTVKHAQ